MQLQTIIKKTKDDAKYCCSDVVSFKCAQLRGKLDIFIFFYYLTISGWRILCHDFEESLRNVIIHFANVLVTKTQLW